MKKISLLVALLGCLCASPACKKEKSEKPAVLTECLEAKLEEFKQSPYATRIVRINQPGSPLYWLVNDVYADEGEPVLNEQCEVVCLLDCKCFPNDDVCTFTQEFTFETIWER